MTIGKARPPLVSDLALSPTPLIPTMTLHAAFATTVSRSVDTLFRVLYKILHLHATSQSPRLSAFPGTFVSSPTNDSRTVDDSHILGSEEVRLGTMC